MVGANWTLVVINNNNNNKEGIKQEGRWRGGTGGSWREVVGVDMVKTHHIHLWEFHRILK